MRANRFTHVFALFFFTTTIVAWPGMRHKKSSESYIGPACTVGAHNWHPESGDCPNMVQPSPPGPSSNRTHVWPAQYSVEWKFYFVPDNSDVPPYNPLPTTPYNVTTGRTYYFNDPITGDRNMKEVYDSFCIPVFGNPLASMGHGNKYSCDFLNVGATNTSYVILHSDKPHNAPSCCIIGQPFHAPPPDFSTLMPIHWTDKVGEIAVDWNAIYDKYVVYFRVVLSKLVILIDSCVLCFLHLRDAGIFNYGFVSDSENIPFAFYMKVKHYRTN